MSQLRIFPPARRDSENFKGKIRGQGIHVTVGRYADGRPCEVFVDCMKQGVGMRTLMHAFAQVVSIALQRGATVDELARSMKGLETPGDGGGFDPSLHAAFVFQCLEEAAGGMPPPMAADEGAVVLEVRDEAGGVVWQRKPSLLADHYAKLDATNVRLGRLGLEIIPPSELEADELESEWLSRRPVSA